MLGQQVQAVFAQSSHDVSFFARDSRRADFFEFRGQKQSELMETLQLRGGEWIINCIGWIPQKSSGLEVDDRELSRLLNVELPKKLNALSKDIDVKVLQVATDCVFLGKQGGYSESSIADATDLYGLSKANGEKEQDNAMLIRSSIIGPDARSQSGLFSWYESRRGELFVNGYKNHLWNGVTSLALAKLFLGLVNSATFNPGTFHWTPSDSVSKHDLLQMFRLHLGTSVFPEVRESHAGEFSDRRLCTNSAERNQFLWQTAGYSEIPSIGKLVSEMISTHSARKL